MDVSVKTNKEENNVKKLKFGIIGCGGIANQKHLPALAKLADQVELVAFCDTIIERAEAAAAEYGAVKASLAKSTLQKLMRFVEKVFRPGVFSQIKKNKAAVRWLISVPMR